MAGFYKNKGMLFSKTGFAVKIPEKHYGFLLPFS